MWGIWGRLKSRAALVAASWHVCPVPQHTRSTRWTRPEAAWMQSLLIMTLTPEHASNPMKRKHAVSWLFFSLLLGGCSLDRSYGPDTGFPGSPTVIYRVTATPDTVAPGDWVRLKCVVSDSLDPRINYLWNDLIVPGQQVLSRESEIVVQAPSDRPASRVLYAVQVTRSGFDGSASGYVSFYVR